jgi:hypothetical protein
MDLRLFAKIKFLLLPPLLDSRVIKGLKALSIDSTTGVTRTLCLHNFQGLEVLSPQDPLRHSTQEGIR